MPHDASWPGPAEICCNFGKISEVLRISRRPLDSSPRSRNPGGAGRSISESPGIFLHGSLQSVHLQNAAKNQINPSSNMAQTL